MDRASGETDLKLEPPSGLSEADTWRVLPGWLLMELELEALLSSP